MNVTTAIRRDARLSTGGLTIRNKLTPWFFILPGLAFTFIFRYYTMFQAFWISLHSYSIANPPGDFVGLSNYITMLKNPDFWGAWYNTIYLTILQLVLVFFIPIVQAIFLSEVIRGRGIFTTLFLIPAVVPLSVNVILWKWIFNPNYGLANLVVSWFGIPAQTWYSNPELTKLCIIIPEMVGGGFSVLLYLSAILGVSKDIYEAAQIDGCSGFKKLIYITLPNIKFLIIIQLILSMIFTLQMLNQPLQYTNGGPNGASTTIALFVYSQMTDRVQYGNATAVAFMMLVVIAVITYIQMRLDNSEKN